MPTCLFLLHWPDFAGSDAHPPALVGAALRRRLSVRDPRHAAYVWVAPGDPAAAAFNRWGMELLPSPLDAENAGELTRRYPDARRVVLAMDEHRAAAIAPALRALGREVSVWLPSCAAPARDLPNARTLEEMLLLRTAHPVEVFADWHTLEETARRLGVATEPGAATASLLRSAALVGTVITGRLFGAGGEGEGLEFAPQLDTRTSPILDGLRGRETMERALADALDGANAQSTPSTWILVVGGETSWLPEVLRRAHPRGIRVLLWTADAAQLSPELQSEADGCAELPLVMQLDEAPPFSVSRSDIRVLSTSIRETTAPQGDGAEVEGGARRAAQEGLPSEGREGVHETASAEGGTARLGPWVRLVYHTECLLRTGGASRISFRKLAAGLAELEEFGPTAANALMWLNRARADGMLLVDQEGGRAEDMARTPLCRPNGEHPVSRAAVEVPDRCLRLLHQMLQKMPWVSFKLLRSVLLREQWLGGAPYRLDEAGVDEWLNFLIHDGAISMSKEPNLVNPDYPVTALRLHHSHPLSRTVTAESADGSRLAAERAILAVDHFLTRNRKPWMSISALRRALDAIGREELQEVLQGLQSLGALVTESYPNPQKEHPTTGCRLHPDVPVVSEALKTRNVIIRAAQQHQRFRGWVPLARLDDELREEQPGASDTYRLAWYLLLRDEGILELDQPALPDGEWEAVRCRLNVSDAVVRAVVAEASMGEASVPAAGATA